MKLKSGIPCFLILLFILFLCGCSAAQGSPVRDNTPAQNPPASDEPVKEPSEQAEAFVQVSFVDELPAQYEEFTADTADPQVKVLFSAEGVVNDFKLLSLTLDEVDDSGKMSFSSQEIYSLQTLSGDKPLVASLTFFGTIPNNGFSYTDASGQKKSYALVESGQDGSLMLMEF